ncbi:MAG: tRNA dihydrouridine(20/20a) synthase DusA [Alphaproteobacteria bacterium]
MTPLAAAPAPDRRLSVAPMMDHTDRHCRYFLRLLSRRVLLYSEMVTTAAVLCGERQRLIGFDPAEHPIALQLGGADPSALAECARIAEAFGYDEVNLNLGCPSERVRDARFGACLMAEPELVARGVSAMIRAQRLPVTVKTRIGIDRRDSYGELATLIGRLADAGCRSFAIHARKAWLRGLSPKENREIPPLRWDVVHRLKADHPGLEIVLNGGIMSLEQAESHLPHVDGIMIGRAAYHDPYILAEADRRFFDAAAPVPTRHQVIAGLLPYVERMQGDGVPLHAVTRHILGLFQGVPGAKAWRRALGAEAVQPNAGCAVIRDAAARLPEAALAAYRPMSHPPAFALDASRAA